MADNYAVSMKSGLEDRNNLLLICHSLTRETGLNEVRPGRPEQWGGPIRHTLPV